MTLAGRFASATLQLTVSSMLVRLLALVTMPVLTRLLVPESYGISAMITTSLTLVSVVALAGADMSYATRFHAAQPPNGAAVEAFVWRYLAVATAVAACLGGVAWWWVIAGWFDLPVYLGAVLALGVVLNVANTLAQTRARLNARYRLLAIATLIGGILGAATGIGLARYWRTDALPLIAAVFVTYLVPVLVVGVPSWRVLATPSGLSGNQRLAVIKVGLAGIVTAPMFWVLQSLDLWFIGKYEGPGSVGVYSVGASVALMGAVVSVAIQAVWLPEASREYGRDPVAARRTLGHLAERLIVSMSLVWLATSAAGGDLVRLLAGPKFHSAAEVVPFIASAMFFNGVSQLASGGLLLRNKLNQSIWCWLLAAVLSLVLNAMLVPALGRLGAALTQSLAFGFAALAMWFSARRYFKLELRAARLTVVLGFVVLMGALMQPDWSPGSPLASLFLKFPLGVAVTLAVFWFVAPEVLQLMARRVRRLKTT